MTTNALKTQLSATIQPRLPAAPIEYDQRYIEQYSNVLRLYFSGIDSNFSGLFAYPSASNSQIRPGGAYLNFPYAAAQRTTDKTFTANTATLVTLDLNDYLNDCVNTGTDGFVVKTAGIYNYQFSVQWANTDTQIRTGYVWLRINGVDVPGTASKFDVPSTHGGVHGYLLAAANFYVQLNAGDHVDLYAAVNNAALYMEAYPVQTTPFPMPSIPSVVATLTFVSSVPTR